jgi:hypothetical protein
LIAGYKQTSMRGCKGGGLHIQGSLVRGSKLLRPSLFIASTLLDPKCFFLFPLFLQQQKDDIFIEN